MGVSFQNALRVVAEVAPAEVTVEAIVDADAAAADTENIVVRLMDDIDTANQKENTESEELAPQLADWMKMRAVCNNEVVVWFGSHLELDLEMRGSYAVAGRQLDEKRKELAAGYVGQMM